jgi:hypothetical protein
LNARTLSRHWSKRQLQSTLDWKTYKWLSLSISIPFWLMELKA